MVRVTSILIIVFTGLGLLLTPVIGAGFAVVGLSVTGWAWFWLVGPAVYGLILGIEGLVYSRRTDKANKLYLEGIGYLIFSGVGSFAFQYYMYSQLSTWQLNALGMSSGDIFGASFGSSILTVALMLPYMIPFIIGASRNKTGTY